VSNKQTSITKSYINEIKQIIISARNKAHTAINSTMIEAYWLGKGLSKKNRTATNERNTDKK